MYMLTLADEKCYTASGRAGNPFLIYHVMGVEVQLIGLRLGLGLGLGRLSLIGIADWSVPISNT